MLETFTGVIISLMISFFTPSTAGQDRGKSSDDLHQFNPDTPEKGMTIRPVEALGGGFKKI